MTAYTNRKIGFMFARKTGQGNKRKVFMSDIFLQYLSDLASSSFAYRAPHANRPTKPRKRFA